LRPTGRLAGTKPELATNTVVAAGPSGFNAHRWGNSVPRNITTTNDDEGRNPATTTAVQRTVM